jgi:hypothetical protein
MFSCFTPQMHNRSSCRISVEGKELTVRPLRLVNIVGERHIDTDLLERDRDGMVVATIK